MTHPDTPDATTGGAIGKAIGKLKQVAGKFTGNAELDREGRLQQAQADAEAVAQRDAAEARLARAEQQIEVAKQENELERERLQTEIASAARQTDLERGREQAEHETIARAQRETTAVEQGRRTEENAAAATKEQAAATRAADELDVARLEREARLAEAKADAVDPEVK